MKHLLRSVCGADHDVVDYYRYYGEPILKGERYLHTFIAEQNEQIVGMGSVWTKLVHPHSAYIGIHVDPQHQAHGIGAALWGSACCRVRAVPALSAANRHL